MSRNPRSEPDRIYKYFCAHMRRQPGNLNLKTKLEFRALVGQFFIIPKRHEFFYKLRPIMRGWHADIEKQTKEQNDPKGKRIYVKRNRRSITDNLWDLLARLYWNHAAWIILRGEYKGMEKTLSERDIRKQLQECYGYLSQLNRDGWFAEVQKGSPLDLAFRDTAESFKGLGLDETSLRVMLSPGRLRKSPPASLIAVSTDSRILLSKLRRIPVADRTRKDLTLINVINAEFYPLFKPSKA